MQKLTTQQLCALFDQQAEIFKGRRAVDQFLLNLSYSKTEYENRNNETDNGEYGNGERFWVDDVGVDNDDNREFFATFDDALRYVESAKDSELVIWDQAYDGPVFYTKTGDVYSDTGVVKTARSYAKYMKDVVVNAAELNKETGEIVWYVLS